MKNIQHTFLNLQLYAAIIFSLLLANIAYAAPARTLQGYILVITNFINNTVIPFVFALALLFFLYHTFRYFILKSGDAGERENARKFAMYGLAAFVFLISIWAITNIILRAFDLDGSVPICPDYNPNCSFSINKESQDLV